MVFFSEATHLHPVGRRMQGYANLSQLGGTSIEGPADFKVDFCLKLVDLVICYGGQDESKSTKGGIRHHSDDNGAKPHCPRERPTRCIQEKACKHKHHPTEGPLFLFTRARAHISLTFLIRVADQE